jgi:hypothetical protein
MNSTMLVEVDIYSGRSNPCYPLRSTETAELMSRLTTLPQTDHAPQPVALGYRGLRVTIDPPDPTAEIQVGHGTVTIQQSNGEQLWLTDPDRQLERWLVGLCATHLDHDDMTALRNELSR